MPFPLLAAALPSLIGGGLGLLSSRNAPDQVTASQGGLSSSTRTNQVDPRLSGAAGLALQGANDLYRQGGTPVARLGPQFHNAITSNNQFLSGQANNPFAAGIQGGVNPFSGGGIQNTPGQNQFASGGPQNTFAGQDPQDNPFIQQAFDNAANLTQGRLASEFSRSGQGVNSATQQALRANELGGLAGSLGLPLAQQAQNLAFQGQEGNLSRQYGATEANLGRQFNANEANIGRQFLGTEADLGREQRGFDRQFNANEGNLGRQFNAGQVAADQALTQLQNQQNQLNQPAANVNQYLNQIGGASPFFNTTQSLQTNQQGNVTQPVFNDPLGQAAGGALLGNALFPNGFGTQTPVPNMFPTTGVVPQPMNNNTTYQGLPYTGAGFGQSTVVPQPMNNNTTYQSLPYTGAGFG